MALIFTSKQRLLDFLDVNHWPVGLGYTGQNQIHFDLMVFHVGDLNLLDENRWHIPMGIILIGDEKVIGETLKSGK